MLPLNFGPACNDSFKANIFSGLFYNLSSKTATWGISPPITCLCLSSASAFPQTHAQMLFLDVTLYVIAWSPSAALVLVDSLYPSFASLIPFFCQRGFSFENSIRDCYWERITVDCRPAEAFVPFAYLAHCWCICSFTFPLLLFFCFNWLSNFKNEKIMHKNLHF